MRQIIVAAFTLLLVATVVPVASAKGDLAWPAGRVCSSDAARPNPWSVSFSATAMETVGVPTRLRLNGADAQATPARRAIPVEYSDAYKVRATIHKVASFATLPLFVANYVVGQDLYNHPGTSESKKGLHGGLAATTGVLFGINTLTGVWNMWEARKDSNHKARRMTHAVLMLAADAGFLATGLMAPDREEGRNLTSFDRGGRHRSVAITSMGVATAGYLMMLLWR